MYINYKNFVNNRLNEEVGLWGSLKNLFNKLLQNVSDEIKKPVEELTLKLDKTKKPEEMKKIIIDYLKIHKDGLDNSVKNADSLKTLYEITKDNITAIYACINSSIKHLGETNYKFEEIFNNSPTGIKKLFSKDEKIFNKNINDFSLQLLGDLGKQFKINRQDFENDIKQEIKIKQSEDINNAVETEQKTTELFKYKQSEKIFEEIEQNQSNVISNITNDNFEKLKTALKLWFDKTLYKIVNDELIKSNKEDQKVNSENIENKINNLTTTKHKDNVSKLINKIIDLNDPKKYAQIRNFMVNNLGINEEDIGIF